MAVQTRGWFKEYMFTEEENHNVPQSDNNFIAQGWYKLFMKQKIYLNHLSGNFGEPRP